MAKSLMHKKEKNLRPKVNKGAPSGFVISLIFHAAAFFIAGLFVVFTVLPKEKPAFEAPPPVERPKMKLKKPKVKIKKSSQPKPSSRIVAKVKTAKMPEIQIPDLMGVGEGILSGLGEEGFDIMPDLDRIGVFGSGQSLGNDFVGIFYDCKRDRAGRPISDDDARFLDHVNDMVRDGMNPSVFSRYYRSPQKLYATSFMIPPMRSFFAPRAFGENTGGWIWMVHYKGKLVYPEDITFRFWGYADDFMVVSVNGNIVINASHLVHHPVIANYWQSNTAESWRYFMGNGRQVVGDWITLKAMEPVDMDVIIGEVPGGLFCAMLCVEVKGVEYERNRQGGPILPMFTTEEPSWALQDQILRDLIQGEAAVEGGPVFNDFKRHTLKTNRVEEVAAASEENVEIKVAKSVWNTTDGKQIEGEYHDVFFHNLVLKTPSGDRLKIPLAKLSPEDREYIELTNPPEFDLDYVKLSDSKLGEFELSPNELKYGYPQPRVINYTFGAKVKKIGSQEYNHELTVEYFAIGKELLGDKYVLLDRKSSTFTPSQENEYSHAFTGQSTQFVEYDLYQTTRGIRPKMGLVILIDKRGQVIQYKAQQSWLWEHFEKLKKLPVGAYMDTTCTRVHATSPKPTRW